MSFTASFPPLDQDLQMDQLSHVAPTPKKPNPQTLTQAQPEPEMPTLDPKVILRPFAWPETPF